MVEATPEDWNPRVSHVDLCWMLETFRQKEGADHIISWLGELAAQARANRSDIGILDFVAPSEREGLRFYREMQANAPEALEMWQKAMRAVAA